MSSVVPGSPVFLTIIRQIKEQSPSIFNVFIPIIHGGNPIRDMFKAMTRENIVYLSWR